MNYGDQHATPEDFPSTFTARYADHLRTAERLLAVVPAVGSVAYRTAARSAGLNNGLMRAAVLRLEALGRIAVAEDRGLTRTAAGDA